MDEENGLDILIENLRRLGLSPNVNVTDKGAFFPRHNRFASSTTVTALLSDEIYFVARSNVTNPFTGIYSSIKLPAEAEYKVYKRNRFDFLFFFKRQKLGHKYMDKNLTIVSPIWRPSKELNEETINLFLEINEAGKPYNLVVENNYLFSIIESLTDKKIIGIESPNWLYEKEDLENLLKLGEELIRKIKKICS